MFILSLLWLLIGLLIGSLAIGARLQPVTWRRMGKVSMLVLGVLSASVGGWLGTLLLGRYFATPTALWSGVVGVVLPWSIGKVRIWLTR